ncbi:radical SAM family heme chaperone HemW [bacterium]|nr:MAG: radical SAM family heme chaperone HemW [bacterium]
MAGIYIHVPFCKQACSYCDFYFVTKTDLMDAFVQALLIEIKHWENHSLFSEGAETIYFGGGTPSRLEPKHWQLIFDSLQAFITSKTREITVEVNPDDVTIESMQVLKALGVTRLSMGVQTFDESRLHFMHRAHSKTQAIQAIEIIQKTGFKSFTVDLIYGNPNQTLADLNADIDQFLTFDLPHISAYSLTIEPRTRLGKAEEKGTLIPLQDDAVSEHFLLVRERLTQAGFEAYEVSNFAKLGHRSFHNSNYWKHIDYIGMGAGAHSFVWLDGKTARRWNHAPDLKAYVNNPLQQTDIQTLELSELAEERLLIGLRTKDGLEFDELKNRYQFSFSEEQLHFIQQLQEQGLVQPHPEKIVLTDSGLLLADHLVLELITK